MSVIFYINFLKNKTVEGSLTQMLHQRCYLLLCKTVRICASSCQCHFFPTVHGRCHWTAERAPNQLLLQKKPRTNL